MRDLPFFTTQNGVASLILKKIPFTKEAYVHIRDSLACDALLKECVDVCRMAGAERIYATGHKDLEKYPLFCCVYRFVISKEQLHATDAVAVPLVVEQADWWRQQYNQKMAGVPAASPLTAREVEELVREGKAYYICRECAILGIGVAHDGQIQALASLLPGAGKDTVLALAGCLKDAAISLTVASNNTKACELYKGLGFTESDIETKWYKIFKC